MSDPVLIVGAGVAGLTAAVELADVVVPLALVVFREDQEVVPGLQIHDARLEGLVNVLAPLVHRDRVDGGHEIHADPAEDSGDPLGQHRAQLELLLDEILAQVVRAPAQVRDLGDHPRVELPVDLGERRHDGHLGIGRRDDDPLSYPNATDSRGVASRLLSAQCGL